MKCVQVSLRETFPSSNITFPMFSICNLKHLSNKSWILFLLGCCKKIISDIFSEISMEQLFTAAILRKQFLIYFYFGIPKMFLTRRLRGAEAEGGMNIQRVIKRAEIIIICNILCSYAGAGLSLSTARIPHISAA